MPDLVKLSEIQSELEPFHAVLVAVSKTKPVEDILTVYKQGQADFGENYVQELVDKHKQLPDTIRWHFIGHLQSNKVKLIAPFVSLIHGADSSKLIEEISKQAIKNNRVIDILLQVHIASEETKFGFSIDECSQYFNEFITSPLPGIQIRGLMGMASFTEDTNIIRKEFQKLNQLFKLLHTASINSKNNFNILSMGMSSDYKIALEEGSTMVRIGSMIFGGRR